MSYGGHVADMISRIQNNKNLLRKRKNLFQRENDYLITRSGKKFNFKKATPEELAVFREQLIKEKKQLIYKDIKIIIITLVISAIVFGVLYWFFGEITDKNQRYW